MVNYDFVTLLSMDSEKKITVSDYLNLFLKIEDSQIADILEAFSFYISMNKNYKYNVTYITDQINSFIEIVDILKEKRQLYGALKKELLLWVKTHKRNNKCIIILDHCFICDLSTEKDIQIASDLEEFSMNSLFARNIYFQYKIERKEGYEEEALSVLTYRSKVELLENGNKDILERIKLVLD